MTAKPPHICVCVCTYRRPDLLEVLLRALGKQETEGRFTFSAVIVDNDTLQSARETATRLATSAGYPISYQVESRQNIALARNCAVQNATGDYLAFIDDDEVPGEDWLRLLLDACVAAKTSGVLAPVRPNFEIQPPPPWTVKSKLYDRPEYPTGRVLTWRESRTGNVLLKRSIIGDLDIPFRPEFGNGGEDQDFFRRLMEQGHVFTWCNEAAVYEFVPRSRMLRSYHFKRALLRGQNEKEMLTFPSVVKSMVAVLCYALLIPVLLLVAHHLFVRYMVKFLDHAGKLCAVVGFRPMGKKYL